MKEDCHPFKKGEGDVLVVYLAFTLWGWCSYSLWWNETSTGIKLGVVLLHASKQSLIELDDWILKFNPYLILGH